MKIVIIFAHPKKDSLNRSLLDAYVEGLDKRKHEYKVIDLYEDDFDPVLRFEKPDKLTEKYQGLLKWADKWVFISPTWWYEDPAILKGFFDKVMAPGFAYNFKKILGIGIPFGYFKDKSVLYIKTMDSPKIYYWTWMANFMWRNKVRGVFPLFWIYKVKRHFIYGLKNKNEQQIKQEIDAVQKLASKLK